MRVSTVSNRNAPPQLEAAHFFQFVLIVDQFFARFLSTVCKIPPFL